MEAIKDQNLEIPPGKKLRVGIGVVLEDGSVGGEIGAAWLTDKWRVDGSVGVAISQGKQVRIVTGIQFTR